jgi:ribosomal protein S27E
MHEGSSRFFVARQRTEEEMMATQQAPRTDFRQIKCPDCDSIMKPITLSKKKDQAAKVLECPKCARRLPTATKP